MAVRNLEDFKQALDRAVLARAAVQHVESNIGLETREYGRDVALHVDSGDPVPVSVKRIRAGRAGTQRYLTLYRPATHQNRDVLRVAHHVPFRGGRTEPSGMRSRYVATSDSEKCWPSCGS